MRGVSGRRAAATSALGELEGGQGRRDTPGAWEEKKRLADGPGARDT